MEIDCEKEIDVAKVLVEEPERDDYMREEIDHRLAATLNLILDLSLLTCNERHAQFIMDRNDEARNRFLP